jgi:hypothetical protein
MASGDTHGLPDAAACLGTLICKKITLETYSSADKCRRARIALLVGALESFSSEAWVGEVTSATSIEGAIAAVVSVGALSLEDISTRLGLPDSLEPDVQHLTPGEDHVHIGTGKRLTVSSTVSIKLGNGQSVDVGPKRVVKLEYEQAIFEAVVGFVGNFSVNTSAGAKKRKVVLAIPMVQAHESIGFQLFATSKITQVRKLQKDETTTYVKNTCYFKGRYLQNYVNEQRLVMVRDTASATHLKTIAHALGVTPQPRAKRKSTRKRAHTTFKPAHVHNVDGTDDEDRDEDDEEVEAHSTEDGNHAPKKSKFESSKEDQDRLNNMLEEKMADFEESIRLKTNVVLTENAALRKQLENKLEESRTTKAEQELLRKQLSEKQEGVIPAEAALKVQEKAFEAQRKREETLEKALWHRFEEQSNEQRTREQTIQKEERDRVDRELARYAKEQRDKEILDMVTDSRARAPRGHTG